jgi:hypothetical protein
MRMQMGNIMQENQATDRIIRRLLNPRLTLYVLFGLAIGIIANIVFHELGHAAVGYVLNKDSIAAIHFYPPETQFTGDIFELFGHRGASLVLFGSIVAELLLWAFALAMLWEIRGSWKNKPVMHPYTWFFIGFYGGLINLAYGWSGVNPGIGDWTVASKADAVRFLAINQELIYPITYGIAFLMVLYVLAPAYIFREQLIKGFKAYYWTIKKRTEEGN